MWGANVIVRNATVWQTYNGGVVNLGWGAGSAGDGCLIDGLYVVKTDWLIPTSPGFTKTHLDGQNDAVIASLMVPSTVFGNLNTCLLYTSWSFVRSAFNRVKRGTSSSRIGTVKARSAPPLGFSSVMVLASRSMSFKGMFVRCV